ncbi:MAG: hypothetical protein WCI64_01090 [Chlorobium sp.]
MKSKIIGLLSGIKRGLKRSRKSVPQTVPASKRFGEVSDVRGVDSVDGQEDYSPIEPLLNTLKFDIGTLLQPKTFLYLLGGTVIFLIQTYNTLAIINLARQNEKLRDQILMTSSVITSQELRVHELHSIHSITQDAVKLGLEPSGIPPVELRP